MFHLISGHDCLRKPLHRTSVASDFTPMQSKRGYGPLAPQQVSCSSSYFDMEAISVDKLDQYYPETGGKCLPLAEKCAIRERSGDRVGYREKHEDKLQKCVLCYTGHYTVEICNVSSRVRERKDKTMERRISSTYSGALTAHQAKGSGYQIVCNPITSTCRVVWWTKVMPYAEKFAVIFTFKAQRYQADGSHCEAMAVLTCPKPIPKVNVDPRPKHNTAFGGLTRVKNQGERKNIQGDAQICQSRRKEQNINI
ncbi:hypothetical protein TNCV_5127461 [Trichonephila clavipes]|nr:hypothetical protein TNCV_5127461 [Trichonephila clavipes]